LLIVDFRMWIKNETEIPDFELPWPSGQGQGIQMIPRALAQNRKISQLSSRLNVTLIKAIKDTSAQIPSRIINGR
jgi:hypothetical protein